jgi:hypothetical protein
VEIAFLIAGVIGLVLFLKEKDFTHFEFKKTSISGFTFLLY